MQKPKEDIFQLAIMILHDRCPPDNRMYLCNMGESDECDCTDCWTKYLFWAVNGYGRIPYEYDKNKEVI